MDTSKIPRKLSVRAEQGEIQGQNCRKLWLSNGDIYKDEVVNPSRLEENRRTPERHSVSSRQPDFVSVFSTHLSAACNNQHDSSEASLVKPQTTSFFKDCVDQLDYGVQTPSSSGSPGVDRTISEVTIAGVHQTSFKVGKANMNAIPVAPNRTLCFAPQHHLTSKTNEITPVEHRNSVDASLSHPYADIQTVTLTAAEESIVPRSRHTFSSQPRPRSETTSFCDAWMKVLPFPSLHIEKDIGNLNVSSSGANQGVGRDLPAAAPILGGTLQIAQKRLRDMSDERTQTLEGGGVVQRVLKRMAKTNSDISETFLRLQELQKHHNVSNQARNEETQVRKRNAADETSEEELKKMRRVRNRESVEKCRAKQKLRLEKLENEERALRAECAILREMAESLQRNWGAAAVEFERITGKAAGQCPLILPPAMELPELNLEPNWNGQSYIDTFKDST